MNIQLLVTTMIVLVCAAGVGLQLLPRTTKKSLAQWLLKKRNPVVDACASTLAKSLVAQKGSCGGCNGCGSVKTDCSTVKTHN